MSTSSRAPFRRLLAYGDDHVRVVWLASLYSILNRIFDLAPPVLIGMAVDLVVDPRTSLLARLGFETPRGQLWFLAALTVVIWGLESVFEYAQKVTWRNLAQTMQHELRLDAYRHAQSLDMAFFEDARTGGLMSILNDDVNQLERFLDGGFNAILQMLTSVLVIGGIFFYLAPSVAWMSMLAMPFVLWGSFWFQRHLAPRYAAVREEVGLLNSELSGNLGGIATIKSYTAEAREQQRIEARSDSYRARNRLAIRLSSAFSPLIRVVIVVGFTATLVAGGMLVFRGELAPGAYAVMVFMTQRLLWPLTQLGETFDLAQRAMASTTRVLDLLETERSIVDGPRTLDVDAVSGAIRFADVRFAYRPDAPVLEGLSLEVAAGETVAIVGATGSGKSTLVKLLLRFYDVDGGSVQLDGVDVREYSLASLRAAVALVSQDVFLFHGTVRENIAYGVPGAGAAEIEAAARAAEADAFVRELPEGYDTFVGERGQKLSGGQRQRISIARAILKDAPIVVFDEATSSVDNETEAAIQRSLERVSAGRTTIVIAHRLSTIRRADRIYVLAGGAIREEGVHEELVERDGTYAALWRVQTGASADEPLPHRAEATSGPRGPRTS